jgi:hypothetical protein
VQYHEEKGQTALDQAAVSSLIEYAVVHVLVNVFDLACSYA